MSTDTGDAKLAEHELFREIDLLEARVKSLEVANEVNIKTTAEFKTMLTEVRSAIMRAGVLEVSVRHDR